MGNIKNYDFRLFDLKLSNSDYWDLYLSNDNSNGSNGCSYLLTGNTKIVHYDFDNENIYNLGNQNNIISLLYWDNAVNNGVNNPYFGLTGIDNGRIPFIKNSGDTSNTNLVDLLTGSTLNISSGDTRLNLFKVSGNTSNYIYDINIIDNDDNVGKYGEFCGGFYQGFYKLFDEDYEVLPQNFNDGWSAEFWLRPENNLNTTNTINELYPENKGMFFYLGLRGENKFWNQWFGSDTGCTKNCVAEPGCLDIVNEWCTIPKESDVFILDNNVNVSLIPPRISFDKITNNFLIYGRAIENELNQGLDTKSVFNYNGSGITIHNTIQNKINNTNPFLVFGRATNSIDNLGNETIFNFSGFSENEKTIDYLEDVYYNTIGFRITDDGRIGYKRIIKENCLPYVDEKYSEPNVIINDVWSNIVINFKLNDVYDCGDKKLKKGDLSFYVNGMLKFIVYGIDETFFKEINDNKNKQLGVPFNISLGGGTQGLLESVTFGGEDLSDKGLILEKNFCGSFMGSISQFKFNLKPLPLCEIRNNLISEYNRYKPQLYDFLLQEDSDLILLENNYGIIL